MGPGCIDPAWYPGPRVAAFRNSRLQYRVSIVEVTPVRTYLVAIPIVLVTAACLVPSAQASERDAAPVGRVTVEGFRPDAGRLLALAIDVRDRAASPVFSSDIICRGVVVARGPNLIVVLDTGGTRIIIISATTRFHGLRVSWAALQANDRV